VKSLSVRASPLASPPVELTGEITVEAMVEAPAWGEASLEAGRGEGL